jgi:hypothetical protein
MNSIRKLERGIALVFSLLFAALTAEKVWRGMYLDLAESGDAPAMVKVSDDLARD